MSEFVVGLLVGAFIGCCLVGVLWALDHVGFRIYLIDRAHDGSPARIGERSYMVIEHTEYVRSRAKTGADR